jgi:hypothetical protein
VNLADTEDGTMRLTRLLLATVMAILLASPLALADPKDITHGKDFRESKQRDFKTKLTGFEETPLTISTDGNGKFRARISKDETMVEWDLSYADLEGEVQQAHIHFGATRITGGISVFLCTNLGNGPAGTQPCPAAPATISGVFMAADVIGPTGQGIAPGELDELIRAIRAGATYANVHTTLVPSGEIRGQLDRKDMKDEKHDDKKGGDKQKH